MFFIVKKSWRDEWPNIIFVNEKRREAYIKWYIVNMLYNNIKCTFPFAWHLFLPVWRTSDWSVCCYGTQFGQSQIFGTR